MATMTLREMRDILGETIRKIHASDKYDKSFEHNLKKAEYEAKVAKQIVNTADVALRGDKLFI